jgi:hypothetical protein
MICSRVRLGTEAAERAVIEAAGGVAGDAERAAADNEAADSEGRWPKVKPTAKAAGSAKTRRTGVFKGRGITGLGAG